MHLGRRPAEPVDADMLAFYTRLLACLQRPELHDGEWQLAGVRAAWDGNPTHEQLIVSSWQSGEQRLLVAVNYGASQAQGYITAGMTGMAGRKFTLTDLMGDTTYERAGDDIVARGLYLDMPPWGYNVFAVQPTA